MFGLGVVCAAAFALSTSGCSSLLSGQHQQSFHFLVEPVPGGTTFQGWTNITVGEDINNFGTAELYGVTLSVESPANVTDLSFLSTLTAQAQGQTVATLKSVAPGSQVASMHIDYLGDLHPLFESSTEIHIVWTGTTNPAFHAWPAGGIWVAGNLTINLD